RTHSEAIRRIVGTPTRLGFRSFVWVSFRRTCRREPGFRRAFSPQPKLYPEAEEQNGARRGCPTLHGFFPTDSGVHEAFDGSADLPSSQLRAGGQELPYHCDWLYGWASPLGRPRGEGRSSLGQ